MRPPPFEYRQPSTVAQACEELARYRERCAVLAGGQSLIAQLNSRQRRPEVVVSLAGIPELATVEVAADRVTIGSAVTQRTVERGAAGAALPVLAEALAHVGHVPTRNRGTVGGSIAFADPTAELPVLLVALGGTVRVRSVSGERTVPGAELFTGPFRTSLGPDELLTAVVLPVRGGCWAFEQRHFRRHAKVCVVAGWDGSRLTVAAAGVAGTPVLVDAPPAAAPARVAARVTPSGDVYGSPEYRRRLAEVATAAAVARALDGAAVLA